jgi:DNA-binding NarL/FixJ family response regulator
MSVLLPTAPQTGAMDSVSIRVAIIDDDRALLDGLRTVIGATEGLICTGAFSSVEAALPAIGQNCPDVLLLDIELPGTPGDRAIATLRTACPSMRVLMLTVFSDRQRLFTCLCNGAHGYLLKTTAQAQLLQAIRAARDGGSPFSPEIAQHIVHLFQRTGRQTETAPLTPQEMRLLNLLAEGYSYQSAADQMNVSVNTVRNYIRSIYEKLHVHSKSEAVSKAMRLGLIG